MQVPGAVFLFLFFYCFYFILGLGVFWCFSMFLILFVDSSRFSASIALIFVEKFWFWTIFGPFIFSRCFFVCFGVFLCLLYYVWIPLVFLRRLHQFSLKNIDSGRFLGRFIFSCLFICFVFLSRCVRCAFCINFRWKILILVDFWAVLFFLVFFESYCVFLNFGVHQYFFLQP